MVSVSKRMNTEASRTSTRALEGSDQFMPDQQCLVMPGSLRPSTWDVVTLKIDTWEGVCCCFDFYLFGCQWGWTFPPIFVYQFYFLFYELALCVLSHFICYFSHIALFHSLQIGFWLSQWCFYPQGCFSPYSLSSLPRTAVTEQSFLCCCTAVTKPILNRKHFTVSSVTKAGPLSLGRTFCKVTKFTCKLF